MSDHRALRFLTAGSVDDGKSTLIGRLLYDSRAILADQLDTHALPVKLLAQTRRHALLAQLLRVPSIVFAINKLDAADDPAQAYEAVRAALLDFAEEANMDVAGIIPVSALRGDNVTQPLDAPWYQGPSLLQLLESLPTAQERTVGDLLIPVQYVARDGDGKGDQPRTLWGRIAHGRVKAGDEVQIFPSKQKALVAEVRLAGAAVDVVEAGQSAGVVLDRQLDVSRGDWIATPQTVHEVQRFSATLAWLDIEPAVVGRKYWVRHGNRWVQARIASIESTLDIHTLETRDAHQLAVNEIGQVTIETQQPLPVEAYETNRIGGSLIIVDPASNRTSGALLVKSIA
jgi:sulfate adenylyltransferase subunit 1